MKRAKRKGALENGMRFKFEYETARGRYASTETNAGLWLTPAEAVAEIDDAVARFKLLAASYEVEAKR